MRCFANCPEPRLAEPERHAVGRCAVCGEDIHAGYVYTNFGNQRVHDGCEDEYIKAHITAAHKQAYIASHFEGVSGFAAYVRGEMDAEEWRTIFFHGWDALDADSRMGMIDAFLDHEQDFFASVKTDLGGSQAYEDERRNI